MLRTFSESDILPDKIVVYAQKGWGKTTMGAFSPKPIILMSRGELGYLTLRRNNLVPDAPLAILDTWTQFIAQLNELVVKGVGDRQTLVLDTLGGFERLCHEHVCEEKYNGNWGETGFTGFMRGYAASIPEIVKMLDKLEEVNRKLKLRIVFLAHTRVGEAPNPGGQAFPQYQVDCHKKTWEPLNGWADTVLFGKHRTVVMKKDGDTMGVGNDDRVIYARHTDAFEAKNRHNLPAEIPMSKKASEMWDIVGTKLAAAMGAGVDPNASRKDWAAEQAAKATPEGRAAATKEQVAAEAGSFADGQKADAAAMQITLDLRNELDLLIAFHKMQALVPKWLMKLGFKTLTDLPDEKLEFLISQIKRAKQSAEKAG